MKKQIALKLKTRYYFFLLLSTIIMGACNLKSNPASAQGQISSVKKLEAFSGVYEFAGDKRMNLKITEKDGQLLLKQLWDNLEIPFRQVSELSFVTADARFPLDFKKNSDGAIIEVTAFKKDVWVKKNGVGETKEEPVDQATLAKLRALMFVEFPQVINSNSPARIKEFVEANFDQSVSGRAPIEKIIEPAIALYRNTGGIEPLPGQDFNPSSSVDLKFRGKSLENVFSLSFAFTSSGKINDFGFTNQARLDIDKPATISELKEQLLATLNDLAAKDLFSGAVLVAKNNEPVFEFASGESNKEKHTKINIDTRFNLGSMNKMFTATSIMRLVEQGKLKLDDPMSKYLDKSWLSTDLAEKITIHHLLSHTSGLGDFFGEAYDKTPASKLRTLSAYKPFIKADWLKFEPGTSWDYSNAGMIYLGAIIEKISGMDYFDYIRQNIYKPLGMKNTDVFNLNDHPENIAVGYIPNVSGGYDNNLNSNFTTGSSAGGGYSTVRDLHKFAIALKTNKLISSTSLDKMTTDYMKKGYGYGMQLRNTPAGKIIGHSGGAPGVNAVELISPSSGFTIIVLTNYDRAAQNLADYILELATNVK